MVALQGLPPVPAGVQRHLTQLPVYSSSFAAPTKRRTGVERVRLAIPSDPGISPAVVRSLTNHRRQIGFCSLLVVSGQLAIHLRGQHEMNLVGRLQVLKPRYAALRSSSEHPHRASSPPRLHERAHCPEARHEEADSATKAALRPLGGFALHSAAAH